MSDRCKTNWYRLNALKLSSATSACARAAPFEIACPEWVIRYQNGWRQRRPLSPRKRPSCGHYGMSQTCQYGKSTTRINTNSTLHSSGYQVGGYGKGQLSIARVFAQGILDVGHERIARRIVCL